MINKKDILKMVKHVHRQSRGVVARRIINPDREWFFILGVGLIVLIVGIGYSAWQFKYYNNIETTLEGAHSSVVRYDKESVERAIEVYNAKEQAFSNLEKITPVQAIEIVETVSEEVPVEAIEEVIEETTPEVGDAPVQFE